MTIAGTSTSTCPWLRSAPSSAGSRSARSLSHVPRGRGVSHGRGARVISSFSAISSTLLVKCLISPSGPIRDKPCSRASLTSSFGYRLLRGGFGLVSRHNIQCRHRGTFPADLQSVRRPETVPGTVMAGLAYPEWTWVDPHRLSSQLVSDATNCAGGG